MGRGFQRRGAATALLISTAMALLGPPTQAQEIGSAVRGLTGQHQRPGPPPAPVHNPDLITSPLWEVIPFPRFPEAAASAAQPGRVTLECFALPTGLLRDCRVADETPEGLGFGVSALMAARNARLSQRSLVGTNPGVRVRFTIRFTLPPASEDQPQDPPVETRAVRNTPTAAAPAPVFDVPGR